MSILETEEALCIITHYIKIESILIKTETMSVKIPEHNINTFIKYYLIR